MRKTKRFKAKKILHKKRNRRLGKPVWLHEDTKTRLKDLQNIIKKTVYPRPVSLDEVVRTLLNSRSVDKTVDNSYEQTQDQKVLPEHPGTTSP